MFALVRRGAAKSSQIYFFTHRDLFLSANLLAHPEQTTSSEPVEERGVRRGTAVSAYIDFFIGHNQVL